MAAKNYTYNGSKRSLERVDKMAIFSKITDKEQIRSKNIKSPDLHKMPIMAINKKLRSTTYFRSESQFKRWYVFNSESINDYKIVRNEKAKVAN